MNLILHASCALCMCACVQECVHGCVWEYISLLLQDKQQYSRCSRNFIQKQRNYQELCTDLVSMCWNSAECSTKGIKEMFPSFRLPLKKLFDLR